MVKFELRTQSQEKRCLAFVKKTNLEYNLREEVKEKLTHLLFKDHPKLSPKTKAELDSLIQLMGNFSSDIKMEFELTKCAAEEMKQRKLVRVEGI